MILGVAGAGILSAITISLRLNEYHDIRSSLRKAINNGAQAFEGNAQREIGSMLALAREFAAGNGEKVRVAARFAHDMEQVLNKSARSKNEAIREYVEAVFDEAASINSGN